MPSSEEIRAQRAERRREQERERREREARAAEKARWASLDACEGAVDEKQDRIAYVVWQKKYEAEDAKRSVERAADRLASAAEDSRKSIVAGQHPFYDGGALARMAADLSAAQEKYKAALEAQALIDYVAPGVKGRWA